MSQNKPLSSGRSPAEVSRETFIGAAACPICSGTEYRTLFEVKDYAVSRETFHLSECKRCGLQRTLPVPKDLNPYYDSQDYISHSKTKAGFINKLYHAAQRINLRYKYKLIPRRDKEKRIIDYGCGAGDFLKFLHKGGYKVRGVEPHLSSREQLNKLGYDVDSVDTYLSSDLRADCITMWHVLEHVENLNALLRKHREVLTNEGSLLIAVPNPESPDARRYREYWAAYDVPRHLWHFREDDIRRLAANNDFRIVSVRGLPLDAFYISMLSEKYKKGSFVRAVVTSVISNISAVLSSSNYSSKVYTLQKKA